jgi:hypothetical protein
MNIEYICHACLFVDTGDIKIVTDPWITGSSYSDQWHLFPKPVNTDVLQESQVILLSHGHEDHFHERSLRSLPKTAKVFYPYGWYGGATQFLRDLGYRNVVEAIPQKKYQLTPDTAITYVVNGMDSIIAIENRGKVFVNINDALHSYPPKIISLFVDTIKNLWPRVDYVFCGFGGASYFPNTIHCPGKNDLEIGEAREQLFAHNFCNIVHGLQPRVAVPFAADFVLLNSEQRWINKVRFSRTLLPDYYRQLFGTNGGAPLIQVMYSSDALVDGEFQQRSPYWDTLARTDTDDLIDEQYAQEIAGMTKVNSVTEAEVIGLDRAVLENIRRRASLFSNSQLSGLAFTIRLTDVAAMPYLNARFYNDTPIVHRDSHRSPESILEIAISSRLLLYSFASDWGGDAITIGYGCDIQVFDPETIKSGLDTVCVRLLTRQPQASRHWRVEPIRVAKHLLTSPTTRTWVMKSFLGRSRDYSDKKTNDMTREWLFRTKCEVCRACDIPLLDRSFANRL